MILNFGFDQNATANRGISTTFLKEEIQPVVTKKHIVQSSRRDFDSSSSTERGPRSLSTIESKKRCSPCLESGCIQQQIIQPQRMSYSGSNEHMERSNNNKTKKRSRSKMATKESMNELRIEGKTISPWIAEELLASPHSANFEKIHLVRVRDDERYEEDHDQSNSIQEESEESGSKLSLSRTRSNRNHTLSLIISLLKKSSRLKELILKDCNLDNFDLVQIMHILCAHPNHPKSLEHLDLRFNKFSPLSIKMIMATHLRSSLHSLKTVKLRQGIRCVVHRNIRDAILLSLRCNRVVLESIDIFDCDRKVQYLLDVNRAKRRLIFCNNDRFPTTLWPLLLEQIVHANEEDHCEVLIAKTKPSSAESLLVPRRRDTYSTRRQASVVYHMFRNGGPMLLQQHHSSVNSTRNKSN